MVNAKIGENGLACHIGHRSYERQGLDTPPTVHEGVAVRQMEVRGIATDKGDWNRWIQKARNMLRDIRRKIAALTEWIQAARKELSRSQAPDLAALLIDYYNSRCDGAWSRKVRIGNLKEFSEAANYLTENNILSLEDLDARIQSRSDRMEALKASMKAKSARKKELEGLLQYAADYRELKSAYDKLNSIKWKGQREKFKAEHKSELRRFHMARRRLEKYRSPAGKIPVQAWRQEIEAIQREYQTDYKQYKPMRDDLVKLLRVKSCVDAVLRQQERTQVKRRGRSDDPSKNETG